MNTLFLLRNHMRISIIVISTLLITGFSANSQCWEDFYIYQTYPGGALCSPQYVTLRAQYNAQPGSWVSGEFRLYTSDTDPNPIQTGQVYSDIENYADFSVYANNGVTVWISYYNYTTGCESYRTPYSFYIQPTPTLYQDYALKCGYDAAKVQLSSNTSGVYFELYKLVEYYDPMWGYVQEYQLQQSNTTGYFEIYDWWPEDQDKYYAKIYQPYGCYQNWYYQLWFEVLDGTAPTISGNTTICQGNTTTLTVSHPNAWYSHWFDAANNLVYVGYQYTTPTSLPAGSHTFTVKARSSDGTCYSNPGYVTVNVEPKPVDGSIMASSTTLYYGQSVIITSSGGAGVPHYWCSSDGGNSWNIFQDSYIGQYSFSFTPPVPGTYRFHLRNRTACGFCWEVAGGCVDFAYVDVTVTAPPHLTTYTPLFNSSNFTRPIDQSKPVGTITASSGATATGGVAYSIPIYTPPGTNGQEPAVSVSYNSQSGAGIAGWGWNIDGLSLITRNGRDIYHNGLVKAVSFTNQDAFLLDGLRLNPIAGTNGANGTTYALEAESYATIVSNGGSSANNPEWFKVTLKNGGVMEYGRTADSRVYTDDGVNTLMWRVNRIIDQNGNYVDFKYVQQYRDSRIDVIQYSGNINTGLLPYNTVKFNYDQRSDPSTTYEAGASISSKHLLKSIVIQHEGANIKGYQFNYGFDNVSSFLKEVIETGTDGTALNSTLFLYGDQPQNLQVQTTTALTGSYDFFAGDFNADGKTDLLAANLFYDQGIKYHNRYDILSEIYAGSSYLLYTQPLTAGNAVEVVNKKFTNFLTSDYNGDGVDDVLQMKTGFQSINPSGNKRVLEKVTINYTGAFNPSTGSTDHTPQDYPAPYTFETHNFIHEKGNFFLPGDFTGDGNQDYILILGRKRTEPGWPRPTDYFGYKAFLTSPATNEINSEIINFGYGSYPSPDFYANTIAEADAIIPIDFDGDGKMEILVTKDAQSYVIAIQLIPPSTGYSYAGAVLLTTTEVEKNSRVYPGDFNGDRKTDLLVRSNNAWKILYSTGVSYVVQGFGFNQWPNITGTYSDDKLIISDFNGDGRSDILHGFPVWVGGVSSTSRFSVYYSRGSITGTPFHHEQYDYNNVLSFGEFTVGDFNGDGRSDLLNRYHVQSPADFISFKPFGKERLLVKVMDGHNVTTSFNYQLLTDKNTDPSFYNRTIATTDPANVNPFNYVQFPVYAVKSITAPNGIGGSISNSFQYENAVVHRHAKGFLGFKKITAVNSATGVRSITEKEINTQFALPYTVRHRTYQGSANTLVGEVSTTSSFISLSTGYQDPKRFVMRTDKVISTDHIKGIATETVSTYDNYSNVTSQTFKLGAPSGSTVSATETVTITTTYGIHNTPVPALPDQVTSTKTRAGMPSISNTIQFTYHANGLPHTQISFAGLPKAVTTTATYNGFGNLITETISAPGVTNRVTTRSYDAKGRKVQTKQISSGSLSQSESYAYDFRWGKTLTHTGSDCLNTSFEYDVFGRLKKTMMPEGHAITHQLFWDVQGEQVHYSVTDHPGGSPDVKTWFDKLGREIKIQTAGFNGQWLTQLKTFDGKGQLASQTNQYYSNETPVTTSYSYDDFGRLTFESNALHAVSYSYTPLSGGRNQVTATSSGQSNSKIMDATGKVVSALDNGGQLDYTYDSHGNQLSVSHGATTLVSSVYDAYDRQQSMTDKNAGTITFDHDAFGQLKQETNHSGHTFNIVYDDLGRMTSRTGPEGATSYEYYFDNVTGCTNNNISKVTSYSGSVKTFTYDNLKRLKTETTTIDGTAYTTTFDYDNYSNVSKITYPSGVVVQNGYDANGELTAISGGDAASPRPLFTATQMNGFGQYSAYTLGNNRNSQTTYSNGFPTRYYTPGIQDLNMGFDYSKGNLQYRQDAIKGVTENFQYDALNRLTQSSVNGAVQQTVNYDGNGSFSMGNITSKTDAGNYVYKNDKIHAVAYITNPAGAQVPPTYIPQTEQIISYTPFLKPATITENNYQLQFTYGAGFERVKTVLQQYGSTIETKYFLGNYEKQVVGGTTREIHYVNNGQGPVAMIVRENGVNQFYFVYTDHLGSLLTLTDVNGNVVAEQNFDPWGRFRNPSTWQYAGAPAVPAWLYRGFTGHEHLPQFSLVNMNGRLYDPIMARMVSPDNYVPDPLNTQGYNRYAYALNNPLLYSDPDGNFPWLVFAIGAFIGAYSGGMIANGGELNPLKWDYSSGRTWAYMLGGAIVGGASASLGAVIGGTGAPFANTAALMFSSFTNSLGMAIVTGGQTPVGISFGIASFNFDTQEFGYLGKKGNGILGNLGYAMGALANIQDVLAGLKPESVFLQTEKTAPEVDPATGEVIGGKDLIGHTQLVDKDGNILIDFGPAKAGDGRFIGFSPGSNDWEKGVQVIDKSDNLIKTAVEIKGVNVARLTRISNRLNDNAGSYNFILRSCSSVASRALTASGVRLFGGIHPYTLRLAAILRSEGLRPAFFSHYLTGNQ